MTCVSIELLVAMEPTVKKRIYTLVHNGLRSEVAIPLVKTCHLLMFDGGAQPNPGAAGAGAVIYSPDGRCLWERGEFIPKATNNIAEYRGLEIGLDTAYRQGIRTLKIEGDSNLVIQQITGVWAVNNAGMIGANKRVMELIRKFDYVVCRHVYREFNTHADALTNELVMNRTNFERIP
jgi:ribonuclease HI